MTSYLNIRCRFPWGSDQCRCIRITPSAGGLSLGFRHRQWRSQDRQRSASRRSCEGSIMVEESAVRYGIRKWAERFKGLEPLPSLTPSPPAITIGAFNAVSAITGAANATVNVGPTDARLTWIGAAPVLQSAGFYNGPGGATPAYSGKRIRFVHTGRRFEMRLASAFALMPSIFVNGQLVSNVPNGAGLINAGNQLVLVDFGADTQMQKAVAVSIASAGAGAVTGDEFTLAGGISSTPAVIKASRVP